MSANSTDRTAFQTVVYALGFTLVLCVAGVIALDVIGKPVDDLLKQIAVGTLAGLAGLLARTPTETPGVQAVVGVPGGQPVAVAPEPEPAPRGPQLPPAPLAAPVAAPVAAPPVAPPVA